MQKIICRGIGILLLMVAQMPTAAPAFADETKPVFEFDCINFSGRFLGGAPVKKKAHPGLAVDGTAWSIDPESKHVIVSRIFAGEAAEKAGIQTGDQIVSVNGYPTTGSPIRDIFCSYHMYDADKMTESLVVQKKDGTQKTIRLQLLPVDKCNPEEKRAWLDFYKGMGY